MFACLASIDTSKQFSRVIVDFTHQQEHRLSAACNFQPFRSGGGVPGDVSLSLSLVTDGAEPLFTFIGHLGNFSKSAFSSLSLIYLKLGCQT